MHSLTKHKVKAGGYLAYIKQFLSEYLCTMNANENGIIVEYLCYCFVCFITFPLNAFGVSLVAMPIDQSRVRES